LKGKVCVITGGTDGIGKAAAYDLAAQGAKLLIHGRDPDKGARVVAELKARSRNPEIDFLQADFASLAAVRRLAAAVTARAPRVDVLINNAGALFGSRHVTSDNLEETFATNHMAYFVLTMGLQASLRAAVSARVVCTASDAHKGYTLDFDDLQAVKSYSAIRAYGRSKLCNILFTRELARRWSGTGITANCLHPGFVATRFGDASGGFLSTAVSIAKIFAISPEKGAETIVYLASSPEVSGISGKYFYKCRPATPTAGGRDDAAANRLWVESAKLAGLEL
jgi:NAD(P)-dependent dehydrogenase (short-subunit alcohol dehydrogenase family)